MELNKIYQGHVLEVLKTFPDESVNCVITSPPYWGLRDYGIEPIIWDADPNCEHEWGNNKNKKINPQQDNSGGLVCGITGTRGQQSFNAGTSGIVSQGNFCLKCSAWKGSLGLEPTPELYIKHLLEIFDEIKRVLRKDGTCWVNIGDSYGGNQGRGEGKGNEYNQKIKQSTGLAKSLVGIPEMFVLGMRDRGWIRRNTIVWYKRNCMPSSAKDRFTVDFEYVYFFTKTGKYWFEQQFDPYPQSTLDRLKYPVADHNVPYEQRKNGWVTTKNRTERKMIEPNPQGRNKRCVWDIPTQAFSDAHFAVFPEALVEPMIKAGCPEFVCKKCGKAREKIYKTEYIKNRPSAGNDPRSRNEDRLAEGRGQGGWRGNNLLADRKETGLTSCHCNANFESGIVLDPFCGSGTTLRVAEKFNRRWIGIDLNPKYIEMAKEKRLKEVQKVLC